jgi:hypothetical protein
MKTEDNSVCNRELESVEISDNALLLGVTSLVCKVVNKSNHLNQKPLNIHPVT